jgi:hypothetical protein
MSACPKRFRQEQKGNIYGALQRKRLQLGMSDFKSEAVQKLWLVMPNVI